MSPFLEGSRQSERFKISEKIRFRPMDLENDDNAYLIDPIEGLTTNASEKGLFISTGHPNNQNTPLEVRFYSDTENREYKIYGRVAWSSLDSHERGMGIEVLDLSKNEFQKFLKKAGDYWNF